ncbi:MAG TPA: lytic transglycosylase domain-containing protein [Hyphomicrobiaceae bacterium]|nr:lytic transglycosylase domain-containing protein [Hyphomicrobiaceae bacterium]
MRKAALVLAAAVFTSSLPAPAAKAADNDCERQMVRAAEKYEIPLGMLYAVGLTETGRGDSLRPYALNIDGHAVYGTDRQQALREFRKAMSAGAKLVDIGCMQINQKYHGMNFSSVEEMFDPAKNVDYAARFLRQLKAQEGSWTMAVARYHAGPNNDPAQKRYICRVIANMVASGFGGWTPQARAFCKP